MTGGLDDMMTRWLEDSSTRGRQNEQYEEGGSEGEAAENRELRRMSMHCNSILLGELGSALPSVLSLLSHSCSHSF